MEAFVRGVSLLSKLCGYIAAALIGCSVIVVCEMVFVRYALNMNTIWQTDFVTYSLVAATLIGSPCLDDARPRQRRRASALCGPAPASLACALRLGSFARLLRDSRGAHFP